MVLRWSIGVSSGARMWLGVKMEVLGNNGQRAAVGLAVAVEGVCTYGGPPRADWRQRPDEVYIWT